MMLSGIGPARNLEALGIPVVADLPGVGQNLQDHLTVAVSARCSRPVSMLNAASLSALQEYVATGGGPLCSNGAEAGAFFKTSPELPAPDVQFHFLPLGFVGPNLQFAEFHSFAIAPTLLRPKSTGLISLRSADSLSPPRIEPNYLAERDDLEVLIEGVRLARQVIRRGAFDEFGFEDYLPEPSQESREEIETHIRRMCQTCYHPVGTCKMGRDSMAVVDPALKVHGVSGLRVADASVMPTIVRGNTNAPQS